MVINFTGGATVFANHVFPNFEKTLTRTPVTKTNKSTGVETLTDGTPASITGILFRKEDNYSQEFAGLIQNADAVLLVETTQTLNKEDKIAYNSENYRVDKVILRRLGTVSFYKAAQLFKI
jgi:hypothetical protein